MITLTEKRTFKKTEIHDILFSIFDVPLLSQTRYSICAININNVHKTRPTLFSIGLVKNY